MDYFEKALEARAALKDKIINTPLIFAPTLCAIFGCDIYLKLENLQKAGSFKIRGATFKMLRNLSRIGSKGVVTASAGNHAQGVALAAGAVGVPSTIFMPRGSSISKQQATIGYGGKVILEGENVNESLEAAMKAAREGMYFVHPFEDPDVITGQGTLGVEILEALPDVETIIVPVGGGGLVSGIASVVKSRRSDVRIVGVEAMSCPSALESRKNGAVVQVPASPSIADGIAVKQIGRINFDLMERYVDDLALVAEEDISAAILLLLEKKKILAEGAGAVPLSALISGATTVREKEKVVLVISGGNVDSPLLGRILRHGLLNDGRIMRLRFLMEDTPGALAKLLVLVAELKANVLHIYHDRNVKDLPIRITRVELELETRGPEHIDEIHTALAEAGYRFT